MEDLELEVTQLKLVIEEMKLAGIGSMDAQNVGYQPNQTTLRARDVQAALDELWGELHRVQEGAVDMGAPGAGLFDLEQGPLGPRNPKGQAGQDPSTGQGQPQGEQAPAPPRQPGG